MAVERGLAYPGRAEEGCRLAGVIDGGSLRATTRQTSRQVLLLVQSPSTMHSLKDFFAGITGLSLAADREQREAMFM